MNPFRTFKRKLIRWLYYQLELEKLVSADHGDYPIIAQIAPTARIMSEGVIENFQGLRESIQIGDNSYVRGRLLTYAHGGKIVIGDWCYIGVRTEIWSMDSIEIGDRVLIAHDVNIHDGTAHSMNAIDRHKHYRYIIEKGHPHNWHELPGVTCAPVIIEDDVWVSFGVTILKGVRIGKGSVIGACSIVTKDVPPGMFYRGDVRPILTPIKEIE